jgi:general secretion pathway protein H
VTARKHNSGYTLFEIMVVIALLAIVSALVLPSVAHGYGSMELRLGATSVAGILSQARTHALYEGRNYAIVFSPASEVSRTLYLVRDDGKQVQHATLPAHLGLRRENASHEWTEDLSPVHFFADGSSQLLQLDLIADRERGRHVLVSLDPLTGRARVGQIQFADEEQP